MIYNNIVSAQLSSSYGKLVLNVEKNPKKNTAYFTPHRGSWDNLWGIPIADTTFDLPTTTIQSRLSIMQLAPRMITIVGDVRCPNMTDREKAEVARINFLTELTNILHDRSTMLDLAFAVRHGNKYDGWPQVHPVYHLYCHLTGGRQGGLQTITETETLSIVTIPLMAEDPFFYQDVIQVDASVDGTTNTGTDPYYAKMELPDCKDLEYIECVDSTGNSTTLNFINKVTGNVTFTVKYPGQKCGVTGTTIKNIKSRNGQRFLQVPCGMANWKRSDKGKIIVHQVNPVIGLTP